MSTTPCPAFIGRVCALAILTFVASSLVSSVSIAQTFLDRRSSYSVRVVSYNVHWDDLFDDPVHSPGELIRFINAVGADIWNFQEVADHSAGDLENMFNQYAPLGKGRSWQAHKGRNQIIVSKYDLSRQATNVPGGTRGIAMAQVDLPDEHFANDLYILNNHFPCCEQEQWRREEAIAISNWVLDARTPGGNIDLEPGTAISVLGDLNIVGGPVPLDTILHGHEGPPDWDETSMTDASPLHNTIGPDRWTWRDDTSPFTPGILDYVLFTDSVINEDYSFVLNPSIMSPEDLQASGLLATDFMRDKDNPELNNFDHVPVVVDFVGGELVAPTTARIVKGLLCGGSADDLIDSDESHMCVKTAAFQPGPGPQVVIEVDGTSMLSSPPSELRFRFEGHGFPTSNPGQIQISTFLKNFATGQFEVFDVRLHNQQQDQWFEVVVDSRPEDFIDTDGTVTARVEVLSLGLASYHHDNLFDRLGWIVEP